LFVNENDVKEAKLIFKFKEREIFLKILVYKFGRLIFFYTFVTSIRNNAFRFLSNYNEYGISNFVKNGIKVCFLGFTIPVKLFLFFN